LTCDAALVAVDQGAEVAVIVAKEEEEGPINHRSHDRPRDQAILCRALLGAVRRIASATADPPLGCPRQHAACIVGTSPKPVFVSFD
jgi:hypothetical protein